jgi:hypothetical protein
MSEPMDFPQANLTLNAPIGKNDVKPLPVWRGDGVILSCWKLTWRERLAAILTGHIWLWRMSSPSQPPVYITSREPDWEEPHE